MGTQEEVENYIEHCVPACVSSLWGWRAVTVSLTFV
jgi:hypothetical protein